MSRQKKGIASNNLRFTIVDDETHDKLWSKKFTRMGLLVTAVTVVVVFAALAFSIIAFTPVRTLIPGYPDARSKHDAIQNAIRIDSLENVLARWELYSENLRRVVDGLEPLKIDSLMQVRSDAAKGAADKEELGRKDSLLRKEVADEDKFDIKSTSSRTLPIEGLHFFTPLKGVISQGYDKALHPYIDITAPGNSVVMSVLDGTVISAGWSDQDGYTIRIQHDGDIISVYKHNQKLMKKTGDKVTAGTPIAILGGTGSLSDGDHLHFELWHKGEAVDPTKYINF
jgi:murein DD-endopeptidase MepM/ murein hydrolase activator NlpD